MRSLRLDLLLFLAVIVFLKSVQAEEECLGKTYWCYECDSWSDLRCKDPFNWTAMPSELPGRKQCEGCCVKMVMNAGKPHESVRRTCTKDIIINLFMVDHVCMFEGYKAGHMCFCEGDGCNSSPIIFSSFLTTLCLFCAFIFTRRFTTTVAKL